MYDSKSILQLTVSSQLQRTTLMGEQLATNC
jgi:hypothetical protein